MPDDDDDPRQGLPVKNETKIREEAEEARRLREAYEREREDRRADDD